MMVGSRSSAPNPSRSTVLIAAVFVLFAALPNPARELSRKKIDVFKQAVVIVTTYDDQGKPLLQGSGFFITPDRIVTNLHVISHATEIRIKTFAGKIFSVQKVVATDASSDLALLQLEASCSNLTRLQVEDELPSEGDSIILLSNPQGSHWKVIPGRVGRVWQFENIGPRLQITADIFPGSSGGPVLNQRGQVVGIAVMRMASADDLNFAVPVQSLKTLQASASVAGNLTAARADQHDPQQ